MAPTISRAALISAWYSQGFTGAHCFAAGRPARGSIYIGGLAVMFLCLIFPFLLPGLGLGIVTYVFCALILLWLFDGLQILRGRFLPGGIEGQL